MNHPTPAQWDRAMAVLVAIRNEMAYGYRPFSTDSYLPPHVVDALDSLIEDLRPSNEILQLGERLRTDSSERGVA